MKKLFVVAMIVFGFAPSADAVAGRAVLESLKIALDELFGPRFNRQELHSILDDPECWEEIIRWRETKRAKKKKYPMYNWYSSPHNGRPDGKPESRPGKFSRLTKELSDCKRALVWYEIWYGERFEPGVVEGPPLSRRQVYVFLRKTDCRDELIKTPMGWLSFCQRAGRWYKRLHRGRRYVQGESKLCIEPPLAVITTTTDTSPNPYLQDPYCKKGKR